VPKPLLQIIIGSTRPGRVGPSVAEWIAAAARAHGRFDVEVVDLAGVNLPMFTGGRTSPRRTVIVGNKCCQRAQTDHDHAGGP
jgi:NAD(P)H-dependent FMN reductase